MLAMKQGKPVRFFSISKRVKDIRPLEVTELEFEDELREKSRYRRVYSKIEDISSLNAVPPSRAAFA